MVDIRTWSLTCSRVRSSGRVLHGCEKPLLHMETEERREPLLPESHRCSGQDAG